MEFASLKFPSCAHRSAPVCTPRHFELHFVWPEVGDGWRQVSEYHCTAEPARAGANLYQLA